MRFATLIAALLFAAPAWAQTTIYQQSFEDGTGYTTSIAEYTDDDGDPGTTFDGTDFFTRTDTTDVNDSYQIDGFDGDFIFAAQDIDSEGATLPVRLEINDIDISTVMNLSFAGLFAEDAANDGNNDWDDSDFVHIKYRIDSDDDADLVNLLWFENDGSQFNSAALEDTDFDGTGDGTALTPTLAEFTKSIMGTGSTLDIVIFFSLNAGDEDIAIDNIRITGTPVMTAEPEIDVTPTSLAFGNVEVGMTADLMVTVSNSGDADLVISGASEDGDAFSIESALPGPIAPGTSAMITVRFAPMMAGAANATLTITSNDADEGTVEVPLSGTGEDPVIPEPEIDVTPTSVDFGTVEVGMSNQMMVTIANMGDADLNLTYGISGDGFSIVGGPATVPAGGSEIATLQFAPAMAGSATGTFTINSNDSDEGTVEVSLSGTGQEPVTTECEYTFQAIATSTLAFPSEGGQATFVFQIDNASNASAAEVDIWAVVTDGGGNTVLVRTPRTPTVPAGATYKAGFNQRIPAGTADGTYTYTLRAGVFPTAMDELEICGEEIFTITKGDTNLAGKAAPVSSVVESDWVEVEIVSEEITEAALLAVGDEIRVGPNPTRGTTAFAFALPEDGEVSLALYDVQGREVATVVDGPMRAGSHTVTLASGLPSGVYVWQLRAGDRVETGRLTVVR
ncbi:MAG: choice-of-anchor D domain-containing protein [Bacteroidota bacterium]